MKSLPKPTFAQKLWPPVEPVVLILLRDIILFFIVLAALLVGFAGIAGLKAFGMPEQRLQILETIHFWAYTTVEFLFLKGEQVQLDVRFRGGMSKTLMLPRPLSYCESHKQNPAMVAEMDRLLDDYNYADVARILNENGFKTGDGLPLTSTAVGYVRKAYGLKSRFDRLRGRGMLTMSEIARRCGVSTKTISDWRRKGRIRALAINDRNQFLLKDPGPDLPRKHAQSVAGNHYSS